MAKSNYPHKQRNGGSNRGALIALLVLLIIAAAVFLLRSCTDGKTPDPAPGGIVYDPGAVRVKSVSITAASGWKLTAFGNKSILAGEKVDSNKLGFAISIGGGQQKATDASNANTQTLIDAPIAGCYMTGVGDSTGNTVKIDYAAIVTPLSSAVTGATVANVVFIVEWDTAA